MLTRMHISLAVSLGGRVEKAVVSEMSSFFFCVGVGYPKNKPEENPSSLSLTEIHF